MADYTDKVLKILSNHGCTFVRQGKGSHKTYYSPITNINFTVYKGIENRHSANEILKEAGIKQKL